MRRLKGASDVPSPVWFRNWVCIHVNRTHGDQMSEEELTAKAEEMRVALDWEKYPKLAAIFQHRPSVNVYWHELVKLMAEVKGNPDGS